MSRSSLYLLAALAAAFAGDAAGATPAPQARLAPFRDEAELARMLDAWQARQTRETARARHGVAMPPPPAPPAAMAAPVAESAAPATLDALKVGGSRADGDSITNNQVQGVDEGDIVKRAGDHLIVLRRGRLFTVRIGGDRLQAVSAVDAFGPGIDPSGTWYDEMLVSGNTVAVIGYSYAHGGTEVGLFDLDARGGLRHRATYQLRSGDYYSARNYASRLIGRKLVFYSPLALQPWSPWRERLPAFRHWAGDGDDAFRRMLPARRIYRGIDDTNGDDLVLHTVSACDLERAVLACESTAVLGGGGRVFHVAEDAVYVWTSARRTTRGAAPAGLFRLPLDGAAPSMLQVSGSPVDQMGFLQKDGWLNVLVARDGRGEGMWRSQRGGRDLALLRLPLSTFGGLDARTRASQYRDLPGTGGWRLQQRFIGDWLVYGDGDERTRAHALRYASAAPVQTLALPHALERIDALGGDGVLVGNDGGDLVFTGLRLRGGRASLAGAYRHQDASQGDDRTHGFFYRPTTADEGVLGLPVLHRGEREGASVLFLHNRDLALSPLGTLDSRRDEADDACRASCVDWYGNARPIFIGDRVFALMGYELVEGRVDSGAVRELRRVDFGRSLRRD
ncbi:MAG TPA: beta-propeller domain-containing protein [Lysobacter sp.]